MEDTTGAQTMDTVADLPDHGLLRTRLEQFLESAGGPRGDAAVISVNVDRFKVINHRFGLDVGDRVLVEVANRIQGCLRRSSASRAKDLVARIGADEFALALSGVSRVDDTLAVIDRIRGAMARPFVVDDQEIALTACYGVTLRGRQGDRPQELLKHASIALNRAKERGPDSTHVFEAGVDTSEEHRLRLESDLGQAAARGQLELFWQPIVSLEERRIAALEALVRWNHPEEGRLSPIEFIVVAEDSGLILPIGRWVLENACRQVAEWRLLPTVSDRIGVSVNVSGRELQHPEFHESVARILAETGLDPQGLELDIAEGLLMHSSIDLRRLQRLGVRLSIDDFGTGHLSFSYLARLSVDTVKIDGSVVSQLGSDAEAATIVRAMLATAQSFGLGAIAEGIETPEQLSILRALGCPYGQGYLFARPASSAEMQELLERHGLQITNGAFSGALTPEDVGDHDPVN